MNYSVPYEYIKRRVDVRMTRETQIKPNSPRSNPHTHAVGFAQQETFTYALVMFCAKPDLVRFA